MFTAVLLERPKGWNQSTCLSTDEWIMECFSDVKKIKPAFAFSVTLVKTAIIKEKKVNDAETGRRKETSVHCCEKVNCCVHCVSVWTFLKMLRGKPPNNTAINF